jgi:hypothetical protein
MLHPPKNRIGIHGRCRRASRSRPISMTNKQIAISYLCLIPRAQYSEIQMNTKNFGDIHYWPSVKPRAITNNFNLLSDSYRELFSMLIPDIFKNDHD